MQKSKIVEEILIRGVTDWTYNLFLSACYLALEKNDDIAILDMLLQRGLYFALDRLVTEPIRHPSRISSILQQALVGKDHLITRVNSMQWIESSTFSESCMKQLFINMFKFANIQLPEEMEAVKGDDKSFIALSQKYILKYKERFAIR